MKKQRILIVGAGFAGAKAAIELAKCNKKCDVTLLSEHDDFRYYPALYLMATGGKRAGSHIPISAILSGGVKFVQGAAVKLDRKNKLVLTKKGEKLAYDKLLIGLGNVTNYFGIEGLAEHSYGIKSSEEVERFKARLHGQFIENSCPDLNYIIVGGGPTGIELAGALPGYLRKVMKRHGVEDCPLNITLVEALPRLLPRSPEKVGDSVAKRLKKLDIKVMTDAKVEGQTADKLMVSGQPLKTRTVVWTAGVTNNPFFKENNFKMTERGKVDVNEYLEAEPDIFVLGDNANTPFSGMAQTALYDGHFVANNLKRQMCGQEPRAYAAKQPISVIPVGPCWAVVQWGKFVFSGWLGWLLRGAADLIGFHDLQSWPKAGSQWMKAMSAEEDNCPNCTEK